MKKKLKNKKEKGEKGKKRADGGRTAQNITTEARNSTGEEQDEPKTAEFKEKFTENRRQAS